MREYQREFNRTAAVRRSLAQTFQRHKGRGIHGKFIHAGLKRHRYGYEHPSSMQSLFQTLGAGNILQSLKVWGLAVSPKVP